MNCQFYDRKSARAADGRGLQWGLCRRQAPQLNPVNAKSHTIEGIWPTVRDDDWCGRWEAQKRRIADTAPASLSAVQATPATAARSATAPATPIIPRTLPMNGGAASIAAGYKATPAKSE